MSILLSAYYPEGIVYVADKNITATINTTSGIKKYVEPTGTKVLSWPNNRAVIGFVGLANLAGLTLEEYLRIFIASTRDFTDIDQLAHQLRDQIQIDFSKDFAAQEVNEKQLIFHLGGFTKKENVCVPVLYHIWNYKGIVDPQTGKYPPGERIFQVNEDIETKFKDWPHPEDYPLRVRERLQNMVDQDRYLWFNNGYNLGAFNLFKDVVWQALCYLQKTPFALNISGINARVAFCRMAVELFGSYFTYHSYPEDRVVGGGSEAVFIPWDSVKNSA
ncbi:MAG: hypothetical protein P8Y03_15320 [Anaerolineales bacterium]|jgi:hypothetical protein